ncbi:MAG: copper-binding protein [Brachymonas sp.]
MSSFFQRSILCALMACSSAFAQTAPAQPTTTPAANPVATEWVNAEITRLDTIRSRITLKHERIASIKMEAMTMPFKVKDKGLFDGRKVGEKVQFAVRMDDGDLFITHIRSAP